MPTISSRSEEVQEIIGRSPAWVVRMGTLVIACLVTFALIGAWFVRYPDLVEAPVTFTSAIPPVYISSHTNGRIQTLYIRDGNSITAGQVIGVMENAASTKDMFRLSELVQSLDTTLSLERVLDHIALPTMVQVGNLQADYANLYQAINTYRFFLGNQYHKNQLASLKNQITYYYRLNTQLMFKRQSLNEQLALEWQKDSTNRVLMNQKVIAKLDFNNNHKTYLNQQLSSSDNNASIIQNQLQVTEYQKTIANLQNEYQAQKQELISKIQAASKTLVGRVATWDQEYVLRTPITGKITFFKVWTPNQYVKADDPVFVVIPPFSNHHVRAALPVYKAGKLKVGQSALIKLDEYPFEEFGMLRGTVEKISAVALDKNYLITVRLNSLRTTTGYLLPLRMELSGKAQFVTEDRNIIQRIFSQLYGRIK
jgi:multidrug resistance efflux pump